MSEQRTKATDAEVLQIMVTEHTNLQAARSGTIFEANGRTNLYLATVSSIVIALAFIGQVAGMNDFFLLFALILLPALLFMGIVTYMRVLETGWEDIICSRGINRIRHYYLEVAPHMKDYFILSAHDDDEGVLKNMGAIPSRWQVLLSTSGLVSVINSIVAGVFIALLTSVVLHTTVAASAIGGIAVFIASLLLHFMVQTRIAVTMENRMEERFPTENAPPL